jgi:hypothetical protein
MGKWIVVLIAASSVNGFLYLTFPDLMNVAFTWGEVGIRWVFLTFALLVYVAHRLVSK